ncbi:MAG: Nif3-like dinuclear metal center hexameric protein [Eubacteriales bacterium]|nr:Nif3-like dinuclear metal center hexameric protein [Eubacteriales bacterium]
MKVLDLTAWLDAHHPERYAESWDNVGLLVGDDTKEVTKVMLTLDLTENIVDQAIEAGADMIISHHPMIFSGMKRVNNHDFLGRKVLKLIQHGIQYYAMHTNYDIIGMADLSADYFQLTDTRVLSVTAPEEEPQGIGRVGKLPRPMTLLECAEHVKKCNKLEHVRIYGDPSAMIEEVAVCTGSGKSLLKDALDSGAQVYITGDIDHHTGLDAVEQGLFLIDAGHFGTEYIFADAMEKELAEAFPELEIVKAKMQQPYLLV